MNNIHETLNKYLKCYDIKLSDEQRKKLITKYNKLPSNEVEDEIHHDMIDLYAKEEK